MKYIRMFLLVVPEGAGVRVRRYVPWEWAVVSIVDGERWRFGYILVERALEHNPWGINDGLTRQARVYSGLIHFVRFKAMTIG